MQRSDFKNILGLKNTECDTMADLRNEIDRLDQVIVELIAIRKGYMDQAARIKQDRNTVRDNDRIEDVVSKVAQHAREKGADPELVSQLYRMMIEWSINYELGKFDQLKSEN